MLRILIVLNWLSGAAIAILLVAMPARQWIMSARGVPPGPEAERLVMGLHAIAVIGLVTIPLNYAILKRLLAIVETVRAGDPFVAANASRLQAIAWALLALQLLSLVIGAIAKSVSTPAHPLDLDAGFSINGCNERGGRTARSARPRQRIVADQQAHRSLTDTADTRTRSLECQAGR